MDLGNTIRYKRKELGLNQGQFAKACGITQTYLSQLEHNQKEPNLSTLKAIAEALKMPLPILFFLSMTAEDVQPKKRKAFSEINEQLKLIIDEFFSL